MLILGDVLCTPCGCGPALAVTLASASTVGRVLVPTNACCVALAFERMQGPHSALESGPPTFTKRIFLHGLENAGADLLGFVSAQPLLKTCCVFMPGGNALDIVFGEMKVLVARGKSLVALGGGAEI